MEQSDIKSNGYSSSNLSSNLKIEKNGETGLKFQRKATFNDFKQFKFIDRIEQRYVFGKTIGRGKFGTRRLCQHKDSGKKFNMKILPKSQLLKEGIDPEMFRQQLSVMSDKSHPNIVRIIELLEDEETYYVVLENVKGVELL